MTTKTWSVAADYPFKTPRYTYSNIYHYSTAHTVDAVYILGGATTQNIIAEYKDDQWRHLGNLNHGRYHHGSITIQDKIMIVGGFAWR